MLDTLTIGHAFSQLQESCRYLESTVPCSERDEHSTQRRKPAGSHLYPEVPAQDQELFAGMSDVQRNKYLANLHQKKKAAFSTKSWTGTWVLSCVSFHIYSDRFWFLACNCCVL